MLQPETIAYGIGQAGPIKITRDSRGQWTVSCQACGGQGGTFNPDVIGRFVEAHWHPVEYDERHFGRHVGGDQVCGQRKPHVEHEWFDNSNVWWRCQQESFPKEATSAHGGFEEQA